MRIFRSILWIICLLALLAIGSVVALYFLVTPNSVQNRLQSSLNQVGLSIRTNELPTVKVLPTISISLPSAQLFDEQNKLIAFYRSAHFNINPWWLIFGQLHIQDLSVNGFTLQEIDCPTPSVWLKSNETNRTALLDGLLIESIEFNDSDIHLRYNNRLINLQNLRALIASPAPQMHAPVVLSTQMQLLPDNLLLDVEAALSLDLNLASGQIALENLSIKTTGTQQERSFSAQLSSPLTQITSDNLYAKTAKIQVTGVPSFGEVQLSVAELNLNEETLQAPDVYVQFNQGGETQLLKFDLRSPLILNRLQPSLNADHIQGVIILPEQSESIPVSGNFKMDWENEKIAAELFARVHGAPMSFQGESAGFDHPYIKGNVVFGRLELRDFSVLTSLQKAQETLPLTLLNSDTTTAGGQVTQNDIQKQVQAENIEVTPSVNEQLPESTQENTQSFSAETESQIQTQNEPIEPTADATVIHSDSESGMENKIHYFDFLNQFDFDGTIVIGELKAGPIKLAQLKSDMNVRGGVLRLPEADALTYDGKTKLDVQLNAQGHWNVEYRGQSINLSSLLADAGGNSRMSGVLSLQANLYGSGFSQQTLNGQIGFSAARAKLFGFDLDEAIKELKSFKDPIQKSDVFSQTEHIDGLVTIHDGTANIEKLLVNFGSARIRGQGKVDLAEGTLTGTVNGQNTSGFQLSVDLSGNWYAPIASLNIQSIKDSNHLIPKPKVTEDKEKSSGWDKLKNFFRDRF